jgi:hypothetical protein
MFKSDCFPSKQWAKAHGFEIQEGRWLPVHPPAPKVLKKSGRVKALSLFDKLPQFEPAEDPEFQGGNLEDWSA